MIYLLLKRSLSFLLVLLGLAVLIFVLARIVPGDPARIALGPNATPEQVLELREELGLDEPLLSQFGVYAQGLVEGDLGLSLLTGRSVTTDILAVLPATLELVIVTLIIQIMLAIPLGVVAAMNRNRRIDSILRVISLVGVVTPGFVLAILLQLLASHSGGLLPVTGRLSAGLDFEI